MNGHGGARQWLSRTAWHRAIVLAFLTRAGLPMTITQMGAALVTPTDELRTALMVLAEFGAIGFEGRQQRVYFASPIVRMVAA